ncbi:Hypothetical predicted protein [Octopus vulgaris]|uniref:Uncharacterized protein n=1 Tax=Octopus vulgaris TaxID=6645 RepID=A0AA36AG19_OCTVU|nr:Hypothetical predicted protein [Octopus vulgaris]
MCASINVHVCGYLPNPIKVGYQKHRVLTIDTMQVSIVAAGDKLLPENLQMYRETLQIFDFYKDKLFG